MNLFLFLAVSIIAICYAATKSKPHAHQGVLQAYDGKHISYQISAEDRDKLDAGGYVRIRDIKIDVN